MKDEIPKRHRVVNTNRHELYESPRDAVRRYVEYFREHPPPRRMQEDVATLMDCALGLVDGAFDQDEAARNIITRNQVRTVRKLVGWMMARWRRSPHRELNNFCDAVEGVLSEYGEAGE